MISPRQTCLTDRWMATRSNSAEGSGPSSGRGRGEVPGRVGVKTTLDHTQPESPADFRPRLLPLSHFLFFSNFKFLTNATLDLPRCAPPLRSWRAAIAADIAKPPELLRDR